MNNLDIWAIQHYPQQLYTALDNIKDDDDILLFSGVKSKIRIGTTFLTNRQFDTLVQSMDNDILILLMRDGYVNKNDIAKYLEEKSLSYSEIAFKQNEEEYINDLMIKELWFVRDEVVLKEGIIDSLDKKVNSGIYYPNLDSELTLSFIKGIDDEVFLDGRKFKGCIETKEKIMLFTVNEKFLEKTKICKVCRDLNFKLATNLYNEPKIRFDSEEQKKLVLTSNI